MDNKTEIQKLQQSLTGNLATDAPIRAKIFELKKELEQVDDLPEKPDDSDFECFGCGS